jgi:hypothetical protein
MILVRLNGITKGVAMTKPTTSFALRLPPELKEAVKSLTSIRCGLYRPSRNGKEGYVDGLHLGSINEALVTLILEGLEGPMLRYIQAALDEVRLEYSRCQEIMRFFLDNPAASLARPEDFPEGSAAREYLDQIKDEHGAEGWEGDDRAEAASAYSIAQRRLLELTTAQAAILGVWERIQEQEKRAWEAEKAEMEAARAAREASRGGAPALVRPALSVVT